jgi:hypothetical protein
MKSTACQSSFLKKIAKYKLHTEIPKKLLSINPTQKIPTLTHCRSPKYPLSSSDHKNSWTVVFATSSSIQNCKKIKKLCFGGGFWKISIEKVPWYFLQQTTIKFNQQIAKNRWALPYLCILMCRIQKWKSDNHHSNSNRDNWQNM